MSTSAAATGVLARLGARIPIIAAAMAGGPSTPNLVTAAAGAGALAFLAGGYQTVVGLADQITAVTRSTALYGVNLFVPRPVPITTDTFDRYRAQLQIQADRFKVVLGAGPETGDDQWAAKIDLMVTMAVPVVSFTFGVPDAEVITRLKAAGSLIVQTVTTTDEAKLAEERGADVLIVQGWAAGGHSATLNPDRPIKDVPLPTLVGRVARRVALPVWAAGGVSTATDVQMCLERGAEAAVVGTVLLRSDESGASATYKTALEMMTGRSTILTRAFSGRPARALSNDFIRAFHSQAPAGYPAVHHLTSPIRKAAAAAGDIENINVWAGTGHQSATAEPLSHILRRLVPSTGRPRHNIAGTSKQE